MHVYICIIYLLYTYIYTYILNIYIYMCIYTYFFASLLRQCNRVFAGFFFFPPHAKLGFEALFACRFQCSGTSYSASTYAGCAPLNSLLCLLAL